MCPIESDRRWSLDFTKDSLSTGRAFRTANLKDDCTRERVAIDVDHSLPGASVAAMPERAVRERGRAPDIITADNGTEFRSRAVQSRASERRVRPFFIDPGKPTRNPYTESFNGRFRIECLNVNWFTNLAEARRIIEKWRIRYNEERPHQSLGCRTPADLAVSRPRFEFPDPDFRGPGLRQKETPLRGVAEVFLDARRCAPGEGAPAFADAGGTMLADRCRHPAKRR